MATMSGSYAAQSRKRNRPPRPRADELFADALVVSNPAAQAARLLAGRSRSPGTLIGGRARSSSSRSSGRRPPPEHPDYIRALIYNPPPPPPPPLPKGSGLVEKTEPAKPVTPEPEPEKPDAHRRDRGAEGGAAQAGGARPGDRAGGQRNGQRLRRRRGHGGRAGGRRRGRRARRRAGRRRSAAPATGRCSTTTRPPRPIKITRPQYPQEAFVKKIEGMVELEILIDATGRVVARARREVDPAARRRRHPDRAAVGLLARDQERPARGHHRHAPPSPSGFSRDPADPGSRVVPVSNGPWASERGVPSVLTPS